MCPFPLEEENTGLFSKKFIKTAFNFFVEKNQMTTGRNTLESMSQAVWYNQWTLKKFAKYLGGDILEVGCGIGNFTLELKKYGKVWAFDINKDNLKEAKKKILNESQIGFGDIEKGEYFFQKAQFDSIVCLNVLEHIKDDKKALNNLYKLLNPGGVLILLVPAHPSLMGEIDRSIGHYRRYSTDSLERLVKENRFNLLIKKRINFLGALGWLIAGKVLK